MVTMKIDVTTSMRSPILLGPEDLFAVLDQAFRRHKGCRACSFSLPHLVSPGGSGSSNWAVIASGTCSDPCRDALEQLIARYQATHRLKEG